MARSSSVPTWRRRLVYTLYVLIFVGLLLEILVRWLCHDDGGYVSFRDMKLLPFPPLSSGQREVLEKKPEELPYVVPDAQLGWTLKPHGSKEGGRFRTNALALRSKPREVPSPPVPGVTRILLAGDSYTHGDEIPFEDTWGHLLEQRLGEKFEVWNGAVPGYGTDQALLRTRRIQPLIQPALVILGIYREDILRNLTFFRVVKHPFTNFPWSKPRFVPEGEGLRLLNAEGVPPEDVVSVLSDYDRWPLSRFDALHDPEFYVDRWFYRSRLLRVILSKWIHRQRHEHRQSFLRGRGEGVLVMARLLRLFTDEVTAQGARALVVVLPGVEDVPKYRAKNTPIFQDIMDEAARLEVPLFDLGPAFLNAVKPDEAPGVLYVDGTGHPNRRATEVIASELEVRVRSILGR